MREHQIRENEFKEHLGFFKGSLGRITELVEIISCKSIDLSGFYAVSAAFDHESTIDNDFLAGDKCGFLRGKKKTTVSNIFRSCEAP